MSLQRKKKKPKKQQTTPFFFLLLVRIKKVRNSFRFLDLRLGRRKLLEDSASSLKKELV